MLSFMLFFYQIPQSIFLHSFIYFLSLFRTLQFRKSLGQMWFYFFLMSLKVWSSHKFERVQRYIPASDWLFCCRFSFEKHPLICGGITAAVSMRHIQGLHKRSGIWNADGVGSVLPLSCTVVLCSASSHCIINHHHQVSRTPAAVMSFFSTQWQR